jgi:hypothetical protein
MEAHVWLKNLCFPHVVKDTGWTDSPTSNPRRGFHDYIRDIEFESELSKHDIKLLCESLAKDPKCPGWTGVSCNDGFTHMRTTYRFYTTWDSSD